MSKYDGTFQFQLYGSGSAYGFLDGNWANWDIKKAPNGNFEVDEGSGLQRVLNVGNIGSGGALASSNVYANSAHLTDTSSPLHLSGWIYMEDTTDGIYWNNGGGNGWHISPLNTTNMRMRSGNSSAVGVALNTNGTADRGFVYATNQNEIGFLNQAGNWSLRCNSSRQTAFYGTAFPNSNNTYQLGSSSYKWSQVHATAFYGDGSNLTGISSAPEYGGTASGSISQGKPCIVNTSGNIEQISQTLSVENPHQEISSTTLMQGWGPEEWQGCWEPISGRLVFGGATMFYSTRQLMAECYLRNSDGIPHAHNEHGYNYTFPGGQNTVYMSRGHCSAPVHNDAGVIFFAFMNIGSHNGSDRDLQAIAGTITPTTLSGTFTWGSKSTSSLDADNTSDNVDAVYIGNNKFFILHGSETYGTGHTGTNPWRHQPKCSIVTLSGTGNRTTTWSSPSSTFCTTGTKTAQSLVYDEASGKVVIAYVDAYNNGSSLKICTAAVDGSNNISFSSGQEVHNDVKDDSGRVSLAYDKNIQKSIVTYLTDDRHARCRVIDVSNSANSFSLGSDTTIEASAAHSRSMIAASYDPLFQKTSAVWQCNDNDTSCVVLTMNTSNNNVSVSSKHTINGDYDIWHFPRNAFPNPDFGEVWLSGESYSGAQRFKSLSMSHGTATTNLTSDNYVGFAKAAASNGGSVTVQLTGSVQENQSGLTAGKRYYVRGDSSLKTTSDLYYDISAVAGRAVSSTKLIIKDQ